MNKAISICMCILILAAAALIGQEYVLRAEVLGYAAQDHQRVEIILKQWQQLQTNDQQIWNALQAHISEEVK